MALEDAHVGLGDAIRAEDRVARRVREVDVNRAQLSSGQSSGGLRGAGSEGRFGGAAGVMNGSGAEPGRDGAIVPVANRGTFSPAGSAATPDAAGVAMTTPTAIPRLAFTSRGRLASGAA